MDSEFAVDSAGVAFDCVHREVKPGSDLSIGQSFGDELEYFDFAFTQGFNQFRLVHLRLR
jgi:hypothetical protein